MNELESKLGMKYGPDELVTRLYVYYRKLGAIGGIDPKLPYTGAYELLKAYKENAKLLSKTHGKMSLLGTDYKKIRNAAFGTQVWLTSELMNLPVHRDNAFLSVHAKDYKSGDGVMYEQDLDVKETYDGFGLKNVELHTGALEEAYKADGANGLHEAISRIDSDEVLRWVIADLSIMDAMGLTLESKTDKEYYLLDGLLLFAIRGLKTLDEMGLR